MIFVGTCRLWGTGQDINPSKQTLMLQGSLMSYKIWASHFAILQNEDSNTFLGALEKILANVWNKQTTTKQQLLASDTVQRAVGRRQPIPCSPGA